MTGIEAGHELDFHTKAEGGEKGKTGDEIELIASSGAIKPLIHALKLGTSTARENAACALLRHSQIEENKITIGRSGAILPLVNLLESGNFQGKKDACTTLYSLCSIKKNKSRAVQAGYEACGGVNGGFRVKHGGLTSVCVGPIGVNAGSHGGAGGGRRNPSTG
ncbi:E3 ubiquitin ligase PUB14 [Forsythia ovata]|uniref:E3 ubiquitin ligase PUB14 n=1 Tax=Forsythia ovata TaxID=205694 RepID=A0ABD1S2I9_9LAMI